MKRILALFLIAASFAATPVRADDMTLRATLQARYAALKVAMAARDQTAIGALLAPGFASVDVRGTSENSDQVLKGVAGLAQDPNKKSVTTLVSIVRSGSTAIVQQKYDMTTVKAGANGSTLRVELVTLSTDTWTNVTGTWLMQRTQTKTVDYFVNGELAAHQSSMVP